jgi:oral-facial-digital syndrome 1 protein
MSLARFKDQLYGSLRERGVVDSMKAQLREEFIQALGRNTAVDAVSIQTSTTMLQSLPYQVASSMVADYLRECGLERSLAVFVPECKITKHMFTREDILSALHVQKGSKLYSRLTEQPTRALTENGAPTEPAVQAPPSDTLLLRLLDEVSGLFVQRNVDSGTQTELNGPDHREVMEERLRLVQQDYLVQAENEREQPRRTMEERFLTYQQEVDERGRTEVLAEVERFKESEVGRVTQVESTKARQQVHEQLRQMETQYAARLAKLQEAEHKQEQLVAYKVRAAEADLYEQRQRLLAQMETLTGREEQLKQSVALDSRAIQLEETRLQDKERALQRREEQNDREFERRSGEEEARMAEQSAARVSIRAVEVVGFI